MRSLCLLWVYPKLKRGLLEGGLEKDNEFLGHRKIFPIPFSLGEKTEVVGGDLGENPPSDRVLHWQSPRLVDGSQVRNFWGLPRVWGPGSTHKEVLLFTVAREGKKHS